MTVISNLQERKKDILYLIFDAQSTTEKKETKLKERKTDGRKERKKDRIKEGRKVLSNDTCNA